MCERKGQSKLVQYDLKGPFSSNKKYQTIENINFYFKIQVFFDEMRM